MATGSPQECAKEKDGRVVFACNGSVCPSPVECYNENLKKFEFSSGQRPTTRRRGRPTPVNSRGGGSRHSHGGTTED